MIDRSDKWIIVIYFLSLIGLTLSLIHSLTHSLIYSRMSFALLFFPFTPFLPFFGPREGEEKGQRWYVCMMLNLHEVRNVYISSYSTE